MTPDALRHVVENLRRAQNEMLDALLEILIRPAPPKPATAPESESAPAPKPRTAKHPLPPPLPKPTTPGRTPSDLTPAVRAANLPDATAAALELVRLLGPEHVNLVSGLRGQLALKRIPHDDALIAEALEAAKRQAR